MLDADTEKKDAFRDGFEKYLLDRDLFMKSEGYLLRPDKFSDIDDLYKQRESALVDVEKLNCYSKNTSECSGLESKIISIHDQVRKVTAEKSSLGRFCGMKGEDQIKKCEEYRDSALSMRPSEECEICGDDIQKLFETGSGLENKDIASTLVDLASSLRKHQESYMQVMRLKGELIDKEFCESGNHDSERKVSNMTVNEINEAIKRNSREDWWIALLTTNRLRLKGLALTKENFIKEFKDQSFQCFMDAGDLRGEISKEIEILNKDITAINDYISVLNGNLKLSLPLLEKVK